MQIDPKLRKARRRAGEILERSGYRISFCAGLLSEIFSISGDSIYHPSRDCGLYAKVCVGSIDKDLLEAILNYSTHKKKEVWIQIFRGNSPNDPGRFLIYRIQDNRIIEHPHNWPIEKVLSSPRKAGVRSQKEKVSSTKSAS